MYVVCMYPCGPNDRYGNEYKTKAKKSYHYLRNITELIVKSS